MDRVLLAILALLLAQPAQATMLLTGAGSSSPGTPLVADAITATLDINCSSGVTFVSSVPQSVASGITVTRTTTNGTATVDDTTGTWYQVANNVLRQTNKGCLQEETRTNGIRNSAATGAAVGAQTPCVASTGTLPTNWFIAGGGLPAGVFSTVIGTGTDSGIEYIDIRFCGNNASTFNVTVGFDGFVNIPATYGQTWSGYVFAKQIDGTQTGLSNFNFGMAQRTAAGGGGLANVCNSSVGISSSGTLSANKTACNGTSTDPTTGNVFPFYAFAAGNNVPFDITVRYGWPQAEQNAQINGTLAAGAQTITNNGTSTCVSGTYTVSGGTGTAATLTGVASGGVITSLTTLTAGSYTVFPTSPAPLTGTGCSGAPTATLIPANHSAEAYPTSPIRTTGTAGARGFEAISVNSAPAAGSAATLYAKALVQMPAASLSQSQFIASYNNTTANRLDLIRGPSGGVQVSGALALNAATQQSSPFTTTAPNTVVTMAVAAANLDQAASVNGTAANFGTSLAWPPASNLNAINLGMLIGGNSNPCNCYVQRVAVWPSNRISNAGMAALP